MTTINITEAAVRAAGIALIAAILLGGALQHLDRWWRQRSHRQWADQQRQLDEQRDRADEAAARERLAAFRLANPLPGPRLAGECARRLGYADACDRAGRPSEANRQRQIAGQLGALSNLSLIAASEDDRAEWSAELAAAEPLIGGALPEIPGWVDPRPDPDAYPAPYAELGTPQWKEAVRALAAAVAENVRPDDFGPGLAGRGVLLSADAYGYAAAPDLPRETVEAYLSDYCLALNGQSPERTWPVTLPAPRKAPRMAHIGPEDQEWPRAIAELRRAVDFVLRPADFRGLMGRGKSQIITDMDGLDLIPFGLADEVVDAYVGDYSLAITGQKPANTWPAGTMPDTDPSRVMPLRDELQPPEFRIR